MNKIEVEKNLEFAPCLIKNAVQDLVGQHLSDKQNRRLFIWSLLNLEEYLGHYDG